MNDADVGKFLLEKLLTNYNQSYAPYVCDQWDYSGAIIEAMRERGFSLYVAECDNLVEFEYQVNPDIVRIEQKWAVEGKLSPRTVAYAAAKALGMEVDDE